MVDNQSDKPVDLFMIEPDCKEKKLATITAGSKQSRRYKKNAAYALRSTSGALLDSRYLPDQTSPMVVAGTSGSSTGSSSSGTSGSSTGSGFDPSHISIGTMGCASGLRLVTEAEAQSAMSGVCAKVNSGELAELAGGANFANHGGGNCEIVHGVPSTGQALCFPK